MDDNVIHMVRTQHLAAIHAACLVLVLIAHRRFTNRNSINVPTRDSMLHRQEVREEMLHDLLTSGKCRQLICMSENAFKILCQKLQSEGGLTTNSTGWEGTASDSRIIKDALTRKDKLIIPNGKFYLVSGGLPHRSTLIAPFRGVRYHLKEYSNRAPQNPRELFNLRYASLRNTIERASGVLKKGFPIVRSTTEPFYSCETQSNIFLACCILHNFLLEEYCDKELEDEVMHEVLNATQDKEIHAL
ncbi:putative nuclease HARBI1 [Tanacetum coccineum]